MPIKGKTALGGIDRQFASCVGLGRLRQGRASHVFRDNRGLANCGAGAPRWLTSARSAAPIPSWAGSIRRPALDHRLSVHTTSTAIMISRADGGRNQRDPAGGRDHAPSGCRNRSGPVAGGGVSLRPPRLARVVPGRRPAISPALDQVRRWSSQSSKCGLPATRALWRDDQGERPNKYRPEPTLNERLPGARCYSRTPSARALTTHSNLAHAMIRAVMQSPVPGARIIPS
jgi:hypothetical protein